MVSQLVQVLVGECLALAADQHTEMPVVKTLSENASTGEANLLLRRVLAEKLPANGVQCLVQGQDFGVEERAKPRGQSDGRVFDKPSSPFRLSLCEALCQYPLDHFSQASLSRPRGREGRDRVNQEVVGVTEHRLVKVLLVAKVIVDGGDVGAGLAADLSRAGQSEPLLRKQFARGIKKALSGFGLGLLPNLHSVRSLPG